MYSTLKPHNTTTGTLTLHNDVLSQPHASQQCAALRPLQCLHIMTALNWPGQPTQWLGVYKEDCQGLILDEGPFAVLHMHPVPSSRSLFWLVRHTSIKFFLTHNGGAHSRKDQRSKLAAIISDTITAIMMNQSWDQSACQKTRGFINPLVINPLVKKDKRIDILICSDHVWI